MSRAEVLCDELLEGWATKSPEQQRTIAWLVTAARVIRDPRTPARERDALRAKLENAR